MTKCSGCTASFLETDLMLMGRYSYTVMLNLLDHSEHLVLCIIILDQQRLILTYVDLYGSGMCEAHEKKTSA